VVPDAISWDCAAAGGVWCPKKTCLSFLVATEDVRFMHVVRFIATFLGALHSMPNAALNLTIGLSDQETSVRIVSHECLTEYPTCPGRTPFL
jgi:hypothetical protein